MSSKRKFLGILLAFVLVFSALFSYFPGQLVKASVDEAKVTAVVAGNFQSKLGDNDWNGSSSVTKMNYKGYGFYEYETPIALPAGDYEYKIVIDSSRWIPEGYGNNLKFHLE
ncbi:MAG: hypothetical protein ACPLSA_08130, partial [Caldanaerobacter sp.]